MRIGQVDLNLQGISRLPYRLPELVAEIDDRVFLVEGERDVEAVLKSRFSATCNSGGAGKWTPDLNKWFAGKTAFIIPDNDDAGRKHAVMSPRTSTALPAMFKSSTCRACPRRAMCLTGWQLAAHRDTH